jgi:hypothetical protein
LKNIFRKKFGLPLATFYKMVQLRKHKGVPFFDPPRTSTRPPAKIYRGGQSLPLQTGFLPYHLDDNGGTWRILVIESSTCSRWVRLLVDNLPINLHFCILNAHHLWDNFQIITISYGIYSKQMT